MKTSNNIQSNENRNRVINYDFEIVRDFDGTYYVNARNELHEHIKGLPEYLPYKELKKAVKEALGVTLPTLKSLTFEGNGRKRYANAYGLRGIEIHQEPLAFGLQDKVVLGSFGESRPYAIGCTVTGYRWDSEAGEFLYILQGEDGKQYADFARNIIPDNGNDSKGTATLEDTGEITDGRELLPEWLKADATVYSTKMWMYGDPFTIDGLSTTQPGCWHMTAPNGFTFSISPEDIVNEFATVAPAPHDKQGREVPQPELHIGDRVILGEFFKTDKPNTEGTIWGKEWDEEEEAWTYRIRVAECVYYHGRADQVTPVTPLENTEGISTDGEGRESTLYERHNITAEEREAKTKGSASYIRRQARMAREAFYYHKGARIEVRIAYRNGTDDPDGMSYKVCWYDETRTGELHLMECENGISLEKAARHMADFSLLSECGLTLREILYPAA